uniref:integrase core domain-containing protein n=1 Tax=Pseudorhodobacter ferrugineus TaxID=77008 RepID=UPI00048AB81F
FVSTSSISFVMKISRQQIGAYVSVQFLGGTSVFYTLREAQILIERWQHHYNTVRPHSAMRYRPPAPESMLPIDQRPTMH